jgi:iron-sulfur cluster repair protein YtfE (RIC family)
MRYQIFSAPHKALRFALNQIVNQAGRIDANHIEQINELNHLFNDIYTMVYSHSKHEDDILFSELDKRTAGKTNHDRSEHIRLHHELDLYKNELEKLIIKVSHNQMQENDLILIYAAMCRLQSDMLVHMLEEETTTQAIFWEYMTDKELEAFRPKIMNAMTPLESVLWMKYIFASHSYSFVSNLLNEMKLVVADDVFQQTAAIAKKYFPEKSTSNEKAEAHKMIIS